MNKTPSKKSIVLCGNSLTTLINFRINLIKSLKSAGHDVIVIAPVDTDVLPLQKLNVQVIPWNVIARGYNIMNEFFCFVQLMMILYKFRSSIFIFYTIKPIIYGSLINRILRRPTLCVITGLGYIFTTDNIKNYIPKHLLKIALKKCSKIWCLNNDDLLFLIQKKFCHNRQIALLPGEGIDLEHYKKKNKMYTEGTVFLMISRLLKEKGVTEFVEAAKSLKNSNENVKFVLIGKHPIGEANSIDPELLVSWTTGGIIEYYGEVDDVRPYIDRSDCIVLPSYREGLPRSILEAFSMEKLVVAANVPGCKQLVKQNVTGFLCEPANVESLTNALKEFMSLNRYDRANMERSARKIVRNYYSDEIINRYYLDYINSK